MRTTDSPETTTTHDGTHSGARFERPGEPAAAPVTHTAGGGGATAAVVLGAIGILAGIFIPIAGLILGVIGLIIGLRAPGARAGVIVSALAIVVSVASWVIAMAIMTSS
jgi:hypothetical protein